ncbi:COMM domain-containing protein 10 [Nymphon striatum]|nr:COMM domain-containing protein 10 [Nymphon striatum]
MRGFHLWLCLRNQCTDLLIQKGVLLINKVDSTKYPLLLSRIAQRLDVEGSDFFSVEEKGKLMSSLSLSEDELELLLDTSIFILQQAAHHICKPTVLQKELLKLEVDEDKCETMVQVWNKFAREIVEKLKRKTLHKEELISIKWQLNLNMGDSSQMKLKDPSAILEFGLKSDASPNSDESTKRVNVEFGHESLYSFYNQLEVIQAHLDSLL